MPIQGEVLYQTRDEILAKILERFQDAVPDVYVGEDGNLWIFCQVFSGVVEGVFLGIQIQSEDMFPTTAGPSALDRHGEQFGIPRLPGTVSTGTVRFEGAGGTLIPTGSEISHEPASGADPLLFATTEDVTIPNPGIPNAPTLANQAAGNLTGTFEYVITFVTTEGETVAGLESAPLAVTSRQIRLTGISLGGAGTTKRRVYRSKDGGIYQRVVEINDNTTVQYDDNIADGSLTNVQPPEVSTAERVTADAESVEPGSDKNVGVNTVTGLSDVPDGVTTVTNTTVFTGGSDSEEIETYRARLIDAIRNPGTGSPDDLKSWSEAVAGVESATVFENMNDTTPTNGHVTVRISAAGGTAPGAPLLAAVQAELDSKDIANITIHVLGFTADPEDVTVDVTTETGYVLADVTPSVTEAITDYINQLEVGETMRISGIIDAVFGLPGVLDVTVTTPATNQTAAATAKKTPGTISVT